MITPTQFHIRLVEGDPATWKAALGIYRKATGNPVTRIMAKPFGVRHSTVARWVNGDTVPSGVYRRLAITEVERVILPLLIEERENEIWKSISEKLTLPNYQSC